ncbi:hypothetical protein D9M72_358750 [compost metagenome]
MSTPRSPASDGKLGRYMSIDNGAIAISEPQISSQAGKRAGEAALVERGMESIRGNGVVTHGQPACAAARACNP